MYVYCRLAFNILIITETRFQHFLQSAYPKCLLTNFTIRMRDLYLSSQYSDKANKADEISSTTDAVFINIPNFYY